MQGRVLKFIFQNDETNGIPQVEVFLGEIVIAVGI